MVSLDDLVPSTHVYRKFSLIWDFSGLSKTLKSIEKDNNYKGYGAHRLFRCLLLQFMEDLSDRELARYIQENTSAKWFCDFALCEQSPDHTVFSRFRNRLGTNKLSKIFKCLRSQMQEQGYMNEVFNFVDASHLIAKANLWKERDKAIKEKLEQLNNNTLAKVSSDCQARIGCKGKNKYWYGYKKHVSVDMQSGLINKVSVTPANIPDSKGLKHVCPTKGAIYADKGYCSKQSEVIAISNGCHLRSIKKNNMQSKNRDLDKWLTKIRSPYERVFSKQNKRVRYQGIAKNQFSEFMNAICFNLKRLTVLDPPNGILT